MPTTSRAGEQLAEDAERHAIGRIVERRHQHDVVGDVEVGVAGRQPLAPRTRAARGIGSATTSSLRPLGVARALQPLAVLRERAMVLVARVGLLARARPRPARRSAPDRRRGRACRRRRCRGRARDAARRRATSRKHAPRARARRQPGIARLHRRPAGTPRWRAACPRRRRRWRRPRAPRARRAPRRVSHSTPAARAIAGATATSSCQSSYFAHALKRQCVARFSPPSRSTNERRRCRASTSDRSARARGPNCAAAPTSASVSRASALDGVVGHEDAHALVRREQAHDLGVHPADRRELAGPVALVVRPGDPGRRVRLPLRRHPNSTAAISRFIVEEAAGDRRRRRRCGDRAGTASCGAPSSMRARIALDDQDLLVGRASLLAGRRRTDRRRTSRPRTRGRRRPAPSWPTRLTAAT